LTNYSSLDLTFSYNDDDLIFDCGKGVTKLYVARAFPNVITLDKYSAIKRKMFYTLFSSTDSTSVVPSIEIVDA